jgi:hypothetical protein
MKQEKLIIYYYLFVPWIHAEYDTDALLTAWSSGESPEDHGLSIAGLLPIQHIKNWDDIKHHFDNEPCDVKGFTKWSEFYEDDGYVHDPCFNSIPDTLKIEWDHTPLEKL